MNKSFLIRISFYLDFASKNPALFKNNTDGVRIELDPEKIFLAERKSYLQNKTLGLPSSGFKVGIISQDPWITVIRDAVVFTDGDIRLHTRVVNRVNDGVAVLPIFENKIVLIRHFRHALRNTILEIPRGGIDQFATIEQTARQELAEEIGAKAGALIPLGFIFGSTNLFANGSHLLFTRLETLGSPPKGGRY